MNHIISKTLKGELKYQNTVILTYKISYPEIILSPYEDGKVSFNDFNRRKALSLQQKCYTELFNQAKETYDYNVSNGYPVMVYEVLLTYTITYNQGSIISLYSDEYEFTGGAHGNTVRTSQNWNLATCKQIPLSYFFPYDSYYMITILKQVNEQIAEQLKTNPTQYFDNYCQLVLEYFGLDQYYITPDSLIVFYQQYDIAPYSSGIPTFPIQPK